MIADSYFCIFGAANKRFVSLLKKGSFMPVQVSEVQVGAFFITSSEQLRKVTQIETDDQSRVRVHYLSKSAKIAGRQFNFVPTKANPPLIGSFISDCDHVLSEVDISQLRQSNVILSNE
jgi:hypothetical protein